jgi:5'-methylthioadenosine phosphorylase
VQVADVIRVLTANSGKARKLLASAIPRIGGLASPCPHGCDRALDTAIITAPAARDPELCAKLDAVAGRVLKPKTATAT